MNRLRVDEVAGILPELEELRPILDLLFARAIPDPDRTWSGSGELGTVGDRLVPSDLMEGTAEELADRAREHLHGLYDAVGRAVGALAREEPADAAEAFLEASSLEEEARRLDRAEAYARAAHRVVRGGREGRIRARSLRRLARTLRSQGKLEEAARRYEEGFDLARSSRAPREATVAAIGRGNVCVDRGRWSEAESWYRRADELLDEVEPGPEHWHVELNLSIVARRRGDLEETRAHLERAEQRAAEVADSSADSTLQNGWGMLYRADDDPEAAARHFEAALEAADGALARVTTSVNLGECLLALDHVLDAGELGREAERIALREGVVPKLPEVYRLLAKVARDHGHDDALVFYERALELIRTRNLPDFERAQTLEEYGAFERSAGRHDSARVRLEEAAQLYDALDIREGAQRVRSLLDSEDDDAVGQAD